MSLNASALAEKIGVHPPSLGESDFGGSHGGGTLALRPACAS